MLEWRSPSTHSPMKTIFPIFSVSLLALLSLSSCETQRRYFDASGKEIDAPDYSPKSSSLQDRFTNTFTMKKTADGIPMAVGNKVSSFQSDIDAARSTSKDGLDRKSFDGVREFDGKGRGTDWADRRVTKEEFSDAGKEAYSREMKPDFLNDKTSPFRDKKTSFASNRSNFEGESMQTSRAREEGRGGSYSRDESSHYFEEQRENSPEVRIMSRDEYTHMTLEESRVLMGRDSDEE